MGKTIQQRRASASAASSKLLWDLALHVTLMIPHQVVDCPWPVRGSNRPRTLTTLSVVRREEAGDPRRTSLHFFHRDQVLHTDEQIDVDLVLRLQRLTREPGKHASCAVLGRRHG